MALPGAGVPIALMVIPLVAVGVEAEAMAVRQSPEATAVAVVLLSFLSGKPRLHPGSMGVFQENQEEWKKGRYGNRDLTLAE